LHYQGLKGGVKKGARMVLDSNPPFNRYFATLASGSVLCAQVFMSSHFLQSR